MFLVVVSVLISTVICALMLLVTRQRLFRQFGDIQRRLVALERAVQALNLKQENDTTDQQLKRLHQGLVRMQENAAERFASLASKSRRSLSEYQVIALKEWAVSLGVPLTSEQIEDLARTVESVEAVLSDPVPTGTLDLLAGIIGVLSQPERRPLVGVVGTSANPLSALLRRMAPGIFEGIEIRSTDQAAAVLAGEAFDALLLDASVPDISAASGLLKKNGMLIVQVQPGSNGIIGEVPGFEILAEEWSTRVLRQLGD